MAAVSPSPDSAPSNVTPIAPSTPPQPSATPPPTPSTSGIQPDANPPESNGSSPPSTLPATPPSTNSGSPPVTSPFTPNAPPPSTPVSPPSVPVTPQSPPPTASPPPVPTVSPPPPQTVPPTDKAKPPSPPVGSPPVATPPKSSPPPPAFTPPPPPPTSSPTPPASSNPPTRSPPSPPLSPNPPADSPPPPSSNPPKSSPSPPASTPPKKSPSPPAASPPKDSPPSSSGSPPPSDPDPASPPSVIPSTAPPAARIPPSSSSSPPGNQTTAPSTPTLPGNRSGVDASQTANGAPSNGGMGHNGAIAIGVIAGVLILGIVGLLAFWMVKRKKRSSGADGHVIPASMGSSPRSDIKLLVKGEYPPSYIGGSSGPDTPSDHGGFGNSRSFFTYPELYKATGGFSDENLLGEGGFGCVYKGLLVDGRVVAVKQLKIGGGQGEREFRAEVDIISRIHHRHLVSLVGYCISDSKRLLVYDYVSNNTLHFHLHGEGRPVLDWATRIKIAAGAARGIAYLHEDCHPRIIHRDIKSSNILLDNNYEAQVSDFGLARLAMDADTHVSTRVMGTFGYLAPEYATSGKLTEKSDVYSFGVVLLELITGRRPVDGSQPLGDESLVEWARPLLTRALDSQTSEGLIDPRLENNYDEAEMFRMIEAAAACVRHSASKRPRMGQVVRSFSISDSGDLSNGLRVGESQLYDSAQQSAEIRWFRRMAFGSQDSSFGMMSQPSQNLGFSTQSRQNVYSSTQHGQDGNLRQQNQDPQTLGFSGQNRNNDNFSTEHRLDGNASRQMTNSTYHSAQRTQNVQFSHPGVQNLNSYRPDSPNR